MNAGKVILGALTIIGLLADIIDDDYVSNKVYLFGQCKSAAKICPKRSVCNKRKCPESVRPFRTLF